MSFDGPGAFDSFAVLFTFGLPPDTNGDVGPSHYVASTNLTFQVYDKSGTALLPFAAPTSSVFAALGGTGDPAGCEFLDDGDPIVLYDHLADRWLISQFSLNGLAGPFFQCIAISATSDPTGAYYAYEFPEPNANTIGDYPHYGVWPDGYYLTTNEFDGLTLAFVGGGNHAFERDKMLQGDPNARRVYFSSGLLGGGLPSDLDGPPPAPGTPAVFAFVDADEFGATDSLILFDFSVDWTNPASSTFTERSESPLAVAAFDPTPPSQINSNHIPQPAPATTAMYLDSVQDRLMHRLQFRDFGTHHSLVTNHTVDVDPTAGYQAGIRYYELRDAGSGFTVAEQASYAPDADHRWLGSAALDAGGNLALGFSVSSTSTFPSVRYAGRLAGDPAGGLTQGEQTLIAGTAVQTDTSGRWGDYSALSVDPVDDCSFWYTQQYYTSADSPPGTGDCPGLGGQISACWHTRVGRFKFSGPGYSCSAPASGTLQGTVRDAGTLAAIAGALVKFDGYVAVTDGSGSYSLSNVPAGLYDVTASSTGYASMTASDVSVTDGGTTTQNFDLVAVPILTIQSVAVDDSGGNGNGFVNADECVSLDITVINSNSVAATGVSGVLSTSSAGVTITASSSAYPPIAGAGGTGTNTVGFQLSTAPSFPAGDSIDLTLDLTTDQGLFQATTQLATSVGSPGTPVRFETNVPVPILDLAFNNSPIAVSGMTGTVFDVEVELFISHTWDEDLTIELVAPDGTTTAALASFVGGSGDNFGTDCPANGNDTRFSDSASTPIGSGAAPFVGTFLAEEPLATFTGLSGSGLNGTWNLRVVDNFPFFEDGVIECWAITVTPAVPDPGPGECPVLATIFEDGFESGDTGAWSSAVGARPASRPPGSYGPGPSQLRSSRLSPRDSRASDRRPE